MKKINIIKNSIFAAIICLSSMFFINVSLATSTAKISVETARLREEPNTSSKILELASQGESVEILENNGEWCKVQYNKITGYLKTELLEIKNSNSENNNTENNSTKNETIENTVVETTTTPVENVETTTENEEKTDNTTTAITENTNSTTIEEKEELGKYKTADKITLKIIPLINSLNVKEVEKNAEINVVEILNNWAFASLTDGTQGWVRIDKIEKVENTDVVNENTEPATTETEETTTVSTEPEQTTTTEQTTTSKTMYVNSQTVNLRESANTSSKIIVQLSINTEVTVISTESNWCYVSVDGKKGYISESLLSTTKMATSRGTLTSREQEIADTTNANTDNSNNTNSESNTSQNTTSSSTESNTTTSGTTTGNGTNVVNYAMQFLGNKYVYGGTTPSGFDCSGFTQYVYKHFGVNINRTAAAQYSNGTAVTNLQAGDLVMFGKSGINHVGIYIGGNIFIHAANSSRGVTTDTLASGYYKTNYVGARRIFN